MLLELGLYLSAPGGRCRPQLFAGTTREGFDFAPVPAQLLCGGRAPRLLDGMDLGFVPVPDETHCSPRLLTSHLLMMPLTRILSPWTLGLCATSALRRP